MSIKFNLGYSKEESPTDVRHFGEKATRSNPERIFFERAIKTETKMTTDSRFFDTFAIIQALGKYRAQYREKGEERGARAYSDTLVSIVFAFRSSQSRTRYTEGTTRYQE